MVGASGAGAFNSMFDSVTGAKPWPFFSDDPQPKRDAYLCPQEVRRRPTCDPGSCKQQLAFEGDLPDNVFDCPETCNIGEYGSAWALLLPAGLHAHTTHATVLLEIARGVWVVLLVCVRGGPGADSEGCQCNEVSINKTPDCCCWTRAAHGRRRRSVR